MIRKCKYFVWRTLSGHTLGLENNPPIELISRAVCGGVHNFYGPNDSLGSTVAVEISSAS